MILSFEFSPESRRRLEVALSVFWKTCDSFGDCMIFFLIGVAFISDVDTHTCVCLVENRGLMKFSISVLN
jgi:hypothetical protein